MSSLVPRQPGELAPLPTAGDVIASVVEAGKACGLVIVPAWKAIVGRNAKAMLADGVPPDVVYAASWMSILRGRPEISQYIAGDLLLAQSGQQMSRQEYEQKLALYAASNGDRRMRLLDEQRERLAAREAEIERRRNGEARGGG